MTLNEFKSLDPEQFTVAVPETLFERAVKYLHCLDRGETFVSYSEEPAATLKALINLEFNADVQPGPNGYKFTVHVTRMDGTEREYGHNLYKYALAAAEYENSRKCVMNVEITMNF